MEPNETQPNNPQDGINLTNDELAAAMGYMTTLGEQSMGVEPEEENAEGQEEELALEDPETPGIDPEAMKEEIRGELMSEVKKELKSVIKEELKALLDEDEKDEE